jgi:hypothetical protein
MAPSTLMQAEINHRNEMSYDCLKKGGLVCNLNDASIDDLRRSLNSAAEDEQHSCETSEFIGSPGSRTCASSSQ